MKQRVISISNERIKLTFTNPWYFLALGCGSGLSPRMPGTVGTLAAIPFYFLFIQAGIWGYLLIVLSAIPFGIWVCEKVAQDMQVKDPACIVWDEFVGLWITLFMLPSGWYWLPIGFLLFRFFDVLKPWPISWLDKNLPGGYGIMLDDVAAGLISFGIIQLLAFGLFT